LRAHDADRRQHRRRSGWSARDWSPPSVASRRASSCRSGRQATFSSCLPPSWPTTTLRTPVGESWAVTQKRGRPSRERGRPPLRRPLAPPTPSGSPRGARTGSPAPSSRTPRRARLPHSNRSPLPASSRTPSLHAPRPRQEGSYATKGARSRFQRHDPPQPVDHLRQQPPLRRSTEELRPVTPIPLVLSTLDRRSDPSLARHAPLVGSRTQAESLSDAKPTDRPPFAVHCLDRTGRSPRRQRFSPLLSPLSVGSHAARRRLLPAL
jgi:hypothetical protein